MVFNANFPIYFALFGCVNLHINRAHANKIVPILLSRNKNQ